MNRRGLTLAELLIVLALVGLVALGGSAVIQFINIQSTTAIKRMSDREDMTLAGIMTMIRGRQSLSYRAFTGVVAAESNSIRDFTFPMILPFSRLCRDYSPFCDESVSIMMARPKRYPSPTLRVACALNSANDQFLLVGSDPESGTVAVAVGGASVTIAPSPTHRNVIGGQLSLISGESVWSFSSGNLASLWVARGPLASFTLPPQDALGNFLGPISAQVARCLPNIPRLSPTSPIYISTNLWVANFNPFTPALMGDINGGQLTGISPDNVSIEQREKVLGTGPITVTEVEIVSLGLTSQAAGSPNHFGMSLCKVSATPTGGDLVKCTESDVGAGAVIYQGPPATRLRLLTGYNIDFGRDRLCPSPSVSGGLVREIIDSPTRSICGSQLECKPLALPNYSGSYPVIPLRSDTGNCNASQIEGMSNFDSENFSAFKQNFVDWLEFHVETASGKSSRIRIDLSGAK
jgi:prepilin-type N-terminal cleavage/methylation domain-containing protein